MHWTRLAGKLATETKHVLLVGILALGGCGGNTVVIKYRALINTDTVVGGPPNLVKNNPGEEAGKVILVYCISEIANTRPNAADFTFNLGKLYVTYGGSDVLFVNQNSWAWTAPFLIVSKGTTESDIGRILIRAPRSVDEKMNPTSFSLFYNSSGTESVLMTREPMTDPGYTGALGPLDMAQFLEQKKITICQNTKQ